MPLRLLTAAFLLASCSGEPAPQPERKSSIREASTPAPPPAQPAADAQPAEKGEQDAAEVLKRYYALIAEGRFADAYRLREQRQGVASEAAFAANYERYAEHGATVGTPSLVAEAGGWLYVEVPVQIYGRLKSGTPAASAGTMTLRRRKGEPNAPWRIYTSG